MYTRLTGNVSQKPEIPEYIIEQLQSLVDLMPCVCASRSALIMRCLPDALEVLVASHGPDNRYSQGDRVSLNSVFHFENVGGLNSPEDINWRNEPDIEPGMSGYIGLPLIWPDGEIFGTICVLESEETDSGNRMVENLKRFQLLVEAFLKTLFEIQQSRISEEALRKNVEKCVLLVENNPEWIWVLDSEEHFTLFNPAIKELLGLDSSELCMADVWKFIHPEDVEKSREVYREAVQNLQGWEKLEIRWLVKDGSIRITESSALAIINKEGRFQGFSGVERDITDRKRIQNQLEKFDELLEPAVQILPVPVVITDCITGMDLYKNPAWQDLFGYEFSRYQCFNDWVSLAYPDADYAASVAEQWGRMVQAAIDTKSPQLMDSSVTCADGSVKFIRWGLVSNGELNVIFAVDLTTQKHTENKLLSLNETLEKDVAERSVELASANQTLVREVLEHLRTANDLKNSQAMVNLIIESAPMGLFVIQNDRYTFANEPFLTIFGFNDSSDVLTKPVRDSFGPDWENFLSERIYECSLNVETCSSTDERKIDTGKSKAHLRLAIRRTELMGEPATVGFVSDVTKEVELRTHLHRAQKMEAIGSLASGIAHDFNNILHGIMGFTEMAINRLPPDSEASGRLDRALAGIDRAAKLVQHILAFSRETEHETKPVLVGPIVKETLEFIRASVSSSIEIQKSIRSGLHAVKADPTHIHQIIMNLCTNASHAMKENGGILMVELDEFNLPDNSLDALSHLIPGAYQRLRVSDTGHGMGPETIEKIFDPYFTTKEKGEGTGLGLIVIDSIVTGYGGAITVQSQVGKGTTFDVYLPIVEDQRDEKEEKSALILTGTGKILFVDDEKSITQSNKENLEGLGYDVTIENDPVKALTIFKDSPEYFDMLITDVSMPKMNGLELSSKVTSIRPDLPVILITGYSELVEQRNLSDYGVSDLVYKPVRLPVFALAIARAFKAARTFQHP